MIWITTFKSVMVAQIVKNLPAMQEIQVQSFWKSPREGHGNPLQYPCLGNAMDRGAWWATVHGATESNWVTLSQPALKSWNLTWSSTKLLTVLSFRMLWRGGVCVWKIHPFFLSMRYVCKAPGENFPLLLKFTSNSPLSMPVPCKHLTVMFPALWKETKCPL